MSATLGTHREYETIFIMRPDAGEETASSVSERIKSVFERLEGHMISWDDWGKRKLAYEIRDRTALKHHTKGYYIYMRYAGANDLVAELERNLRMQEAVLRYMTVRLDGDFDVEAAKAARKSEKQEAAAEA
jgi:small subunit ribosomal protein S6